MRGLGVTSESAEKTSKKKPETSVDWVQSAKMQKNIQKEAKASVNWE